MNLRPNTDPDVLIRGVLFIIDQASITYWLILKTAREKIFNPDIHRRHTKHQDDEYESGHKHIGRGCID